MANRNSYDPFARPTPYEVLGLKNGLRSTAKEIGKAYNRQKRDAKRIADVKERAARMDSLDGAKDRLQRPEDRILLDFFLLGEDLFADLSCEFGKKLGAVKLPTDQIVGPLLPNRPYDDLVPAALDRFQSDFQLIQEPEWFEDIEVTPSRLPITDLDN